MKDKLGEKFSQFLKDLGIEVVDTQIADVSIKGKKVKCKFRDAISGKILSDNCPVCRKYENAKKKSKKSKKM